MFNLTREQRMLVAALVLLFGTGLGVKYWRSQKAAETVSRGQSWNANASR